MNERGPVHLRKTFLLGALLTALTLFLAIPVHAAVCGDNVCSVAENECLDCPGDCLMEVQAGECGEQQGGGDPGGGDPGGNPGAGMDCDDVCGDGPITPECMECLSGHGQDELSECNEDLLLEYPEVSEDGAPCNDPNCPDFEEFCARPENAGIGVTLCNGSMPCVGGGGGTPAVCFCDPQIEECGDEGIVDECEDDCDCIGSPQGGLCGEGLCGRECNLRCRNRRAFTYDGEAFSSCQMVCPTTRVPPRGSPARRYLERLPDYCRGAAACGAGARELNPVGAEQDGNDSCKFYLQLRSCLTDCSACSRNRLAGYYEICSGIRNLMNGPDADNNLGDLPPRYAECANNFRFQDYGDSMMFCLQAQASIDADGCKSCDVLVNGLPDIDVEGGIIGSHTECNDINNFCMLADDPDGLPLSCFGASLGRAWGSLLGHNSPLGPIQAVGVCHMVSQLVACAAADGDRLVRWQNQVCEGFVDGCMLNQNLGDAFPQCSLDIPRLLALGLSLERIHALIDNCNQSARRSFCEASCPTGWVLDLLLSIFGELPLGEPGALAFERRCNEVLSGDILPLGGPILMSIPLPNPLPFPFPRLPGFESGRDPCLTY